MMNTEEVLSRLLSYSCPDSTDKDDVYECTIELCCYTVKVKAKMLDNVYVDNVFQYTNFEVISMEECDE